MDHNLTKQIQEWLDTPAKERDYSVGLKYLLKLSNNIIMYRNLERNPEGKADFIEYQIRKYQKFRLSSMTHEEVGQMAVQVEQIAKSHNLEKVPEPTAQESTEDGFKSGKRADHDTLPAEIQALYVENADIMHRMRELHLKLRTLSVDNATCPDSERYPYLKEIISLDKKYHKNWQSYDSYNGADNTPKSDDRMDQKQLYRKINLLKGKYKKNPSDALKEQIVSLYAQLTSPVESLTEELTSLSILNEKN